MKRQGAQHTVLRIFAGTLTLIGVAVTSALGQGLSRAEKPEDVGLSSVRLARLTDRMKTGVEKGELPGAVVVVARHGKVAYFESFGLRDPETKAPMTRDAIFRIASMTKPFTSLAIMILAEESKLSIADPATKYLPEFKNLKVGIVVPAADGKREVRTEALRREMTIQDLLRHTSGLSNPSVNNPIKQAYIDANVSDPNQTLAEQVTKLAKIPLLFQPGTTWEYSVSTDVLGRIVEVASGLPFDKFIEERITKPLKLVDTGFSVPEQKAQRGARPQKEGPRYELPNINLVTADLKWKSGAGGMVSTVSDYARFCQFWLNGGELDGVRLISRKTVELMTANHLRSGTQIGPDMYPAFEALLPSPEMGQGFGLGFAVRTEEGINPLPGSIGDYYWGGAFGTYFWIDPKERLFAVLMMQSPQARLPYRYLMRELVYQAITE